MPLSFDCQSQAGLARRVQAFREQRRAFPEESIDSAAVVAVHILEGLRRQIRSHGGCPAAVAARKGCTVHHIDSVAQVVLVAEVAFDRTLDRSVVEACAVVAVQHTAVDKEVAAAVRLCFRVPLVAVLQMRELPMAVGRSTAAEAASVVVADERWLAREGQYEMADIVLAEEVVVDQLHLQLAAEGSSEPSA